MRIARDNGPRLQIQGIRRVKIFIENVAGTITAKKKFKRLKGSRQIPAVKNNMAKPIGGLRK